MKKYLKFIVIGFIALFVLGIIIDLMKSPEQKEKERIAKLQKDSLDKIKKLVDDSLALVKKKEAQKEKILKWLPENDIQAIAQAIIRERLKAPSTAEFSEKVKIIKSTDDPLMFHVAGYVDAQNSFGVKLRNKYSLTLIYKGDIDDDKQVIDVNKWKFINVELL